MDILRQTPFGPYTPYELQEWIKELQVKCRQQQAIIEVGILIHDNSRKMEDHHDEMRELKKKLLDLEARQYDELRDILKNPSGFIKPSLN